MSLNKFFDTDVGQDIKLNVGADTIKCNTLESNLLNITDTLTAENVNCSLLTAEEISSDNILTQYVANYTATEGAILSNERPIFQLQFGRYVELSSYLTVSTPSNSCESFDLIFDKSSLLLPINDIGIAYRNAVGVSFGISGGETFKYNISCEGIDVNTDPTKIRLTMKKDNSTIFDVSTGLNLHWTMKLLI